MVLLQQVVLAKPANSTEPAGAGVDGNEVIKDSQASRENRAAACLRDARPMLEALCRKFPADLLAGSPQPAEALHHATGTVAGAGAPVSADGIGVPGSATRSEHDTAARPAQKAPRCRPGKAHRRIGACSGKAHEKVTEQLTLERRYTTKDFTALRAYVQRIPPAR